MKILVVGDGHAAIHEVAVVDAFKKLGHQVEAFYWQAYFNSQNLLVRLWRRVQNKFIIGPTLNKLNADLINAAVQFNPRLIFIYRGTHITPKTIAVIKQRLPDCVVYGYNNDDPFADGHPPWLWRHFSKSVPKYDLVYEWNSLLAKSVVLKHLAPVYLVWNEDYNKALCGAKIALCFYSKLNRDTYTRRCFEIPAAGTLLLSEYSDDLASLYQVGEEVDMFKTKQEMIQKINLYLDNDDLRRRVAANGNQRVIADGHDIVSRMEKVLDFVKT